MSNDKKTLADVKPGGMVRLGDQAERARFEAWALRECLTLHRYADGSGKYSYDRTDSAWKAWQYLSAQPSPGGQGDELPALPYPNYPVSKTGLQNNAYTASQMQDYARAALAARQPGGTCPACASETKSYCCNCGWASVDRQPVGELHLPPDGFYKIVFDDAEVPDESFARSGALDAALRRFEQISNKWNAHLFVRFANNTRDCTVPNAKPAQAVDLDAMRALLQRRIGQWRSHLPADPGAPGTREIETKGEHDYNNDVRIYREGIAVMEEVLSKIDGQAVGNG